MMGTYRGEATLSALLWVCLGLWGAINAFVAFRLVRRTRRPASVQAVSFDELPKARMHRIEALISRISSFSLRRETLLASVFWLLNLQPPTPVQVSHFEPFDTSPDCLGKLAAKGSQRQWRNSSGHLRPCRKIDVQPRAVAKNCLQQGTQSSSMHRFVAKSKTEPFRPSGNKRWNAYVVTTIACNLLPQSHLTILDYGVYP